MDIGIALFQSCKQYRCLTQYGTRVRGSAVVEACLSLKPATSRQVYEVCQTEFCDIRRCGAVVAHLFPAIIARIAEGRAFDPLHRRRAIILARWESQGM